MILQKYAKFCKICQNVAEICQNLQDSMRLTAFFKLYKMCTLLHRSKLNILAKNRFEKSTKSYKINKNEIFVKCQQNFSNFAKSAKI